MPRAAAARRAGHLQVQRGVRALARDQDAARAHGAHGAHAVGQKAASLGGSVRNVGF